MMSANYLNEMQQEKEFEESLQLIRNADSRAYHDFKRLNENNALDEFHEFESEVEYMVEEVNSLEGALYTDEGKKALILENIENLQQKYIEKEAKRIGKEKDRLDNLREKLKNSIEDSTYSSSDDAHKLQDLEAATRSKLVFATHTREVEGILKDLIMRGKHDKTVAIFASKYAYLFAEKASSLAEDTDRHLAMHHIKTLVDEAQKLAYSPKTKVRMEMLKRLENKVQTPGRSKRLIEMNANNIKRKYQ